MMAQSDTPQSETLSSLFDKAIHMHDQIMNGRDSGDQNQIKKAIMMLEDATRLVSVMDLFSKNEDVSEVPTEHLKYLLLPALLGNLNGKIQDPGTEREEFIRIQETYYKDFLQRCNDYGISNVPIKYHDEEPRKYPIENRAQAKMPDLDQMNKERDAKIKRYKEQKELETRVAELKPILDKSDPDEDLLREYHLKNLSLYVNKCSDELGSFEMEKQILQHMKNMKASGEKREPEPVKKRPMKPIIITRDAMQKEVFGLGYKNVPVLSIEEFYEQRVRDGWFPAPGTSKGIPGSLQDRTNVNMMEKEDEEEAAKEARIERDDPNELKRMRDWDEYKDDHRRGEGNRHNMG